MSRRTNLAPCATRATIEHMAATGLSSSEIRCCLGLSRAELAISLGGPREFERAVRAGSDAGHAMVLSSLYDQAVAGDAEAQLFILEYTDAQGSA